MKKKPERRTVDKRIDSVLNRFRKRNAKRLDNWRLELARPLETVSRKEMSAALAKGFVPFYFRIKNKRALVKIPLKTDKGSFQGAYCLPDGRIFVIRHGFFSGDDMTSLLEFSFDRELESGWCYINERGHPAQAYLHLDVSPEARKHGLAVKLLDKLLRHRFAKQLAEHNASKSKALFVPETELTLISSQFEDILQKYGFDFLNLPVDVHAIKQQTASEKNDLSAYYSFEAIDSETGRKRMFRIKVKK